MNNTTDKLADALRAILAIDDKRNADEVAPDGDAYNEVLAHALSARETIAAHDAQRATPTAHTIATATPAGEVPGIAGQWIPRDRCAALAPLLHKLLDRDALDINERHALRILADDLEQGAAEVTPDVGDSLPLHSPYLQDKRFALLTDSQDVAAVCDHLGATVADSQTVTGALAEVHDGDYREVWVTFSARPFDVNVALYDRVR